MKKHVRAVRSPTIGIFFLLFLLTPPSRPQASRSYVTKPSDIVTVQHDELKLSANKPNAWQSGTPLPSLLTGDPESGIGRITEHGALDPKSVTVRHGDQVLVEGKDYLIDPLWGVLGIAPQSSVTTNDVVVASYRYSLLRLDSVVRGADGKIFVKTGQSDITTPHPPDLAPGETRVSNIFVPYFSDGKSPSTLIFPVIEPSSQVETKSTPGRIAKTLAKIRSGQPVKIVCWGDSITAGGDASRPEYRYTALFERMLKQQFPKADISVKTVAAGGSASRMWLYPDKFPYSYGGALSWDMVVASKPDLVIIEFANDNYIDAPQTIPAIYDDILRRLHAIDTEVIFITPSYFDLNFMQFTTYTETDKRPYVKFLHELTEERHLALSDAASRWGHLWKEGIPYTTYLVNSINHPDNRGHMIFAEELMKCFR